jgi:hypothetical protein
MLDMEVMNVPPREIVGSLPFMLFSLTGNVIGLTLLGKCNENASFY